MSRKMCRVRLFPLILGSFLITAPFSVQAFGQEAPAATEPLSLEAATQIAFRNHGDVGSANESLAAAAQRVTGAKAGRAPTMSATLGTDYQNGRLFNSTVPGISGNGTTSTLTTGVAISQNVFDSGRTKYAVRSARAGAVSQLGGVGSARNNLAYEVAQTFFEQLRQQRLVSQREKQVEVAQNQVEAIEARIAAGDAPRSDLAGVRVTLSQAQFDLVTSRNGLANAVLNFRNALGLDRGAPLELAYESPQTFDAGLELPAALELAEKRRPDLISARAQIAASEASYKTAKIDARPNVSASAGYNVDPRDSGDRRFTFGATVAIPLLNGGSLRSSARAALDDKQAAEIRLQQTERDVQTDVETALTNLAGQIERLKNARELVKNAQQNLDTARGRYEENVGIALDVIVASAQLFEAQTSLVSAEFDYQIARSNLDRSTGRYAWENETVPDVASTIEALR